MGACPFVEYELGVAIVGAGGDEVFGELVEFWEAVLLEVAAGDADGDVCVVETLREAVAVVFAELEGGVGLV